MATQEYYVNLARRILEKLTEGMPAEIKTFWDGEPMVIGTSQLPAVIVDWQTTAPVAGGTGLDRWLNTIVIKVVLNKMDDVGVLEVKGGESKIIEVPTQKRLEQLIFARDGTTGQYLAGSILGILRTNLSMDSNEVSQNLTIEFGNASRPSGGETNLVTSEAHITLQARELIQVPVRT